MACSGRNASEGDSSLFGSFSGALPATGLARLQSPGEGAIEGIAAGKDGMVFIRSKEGIYRSSDYGKNWEKIPLMKEGIQLAELLTDKKGAVYVTAAEGFAVPGSYEGRRVKYFYRSRDGGKSWKQLLPEKYLSPDHPGNFSSGTINAMITGGDTLTVILNANSGNTAVLVSADGGENFQINESAGYSYTQELLNRRPGHMVSLYYRSRYKNRSRNEVEIEMENQPVALPTEIVRAQPTARRVKVNLFVMPDSLGHQYALAELEYIVNQSFFTKDSDKRRVMLKSTDKGKSWTKVPAELPEAYHHSFVGMSPAGHLYIDTAIKDEQGTVVNARSYVSKDKGLTWQPLDDKGTSIYKHTYSPESILYFVNGNNEKEICRYIP